MIFRASVTSLRVRMHRDKSSCKDVCIRLCWMRSYIHKSYGSLESRLNQLRMHGNSHEIRWHQFRRGS